MNDSDDTHTPGTDQNARDEDARIREHEPEEGAVDEPVHDREDAATGSHWMFKKGISIGLVSIAVTILVVIGLGLATGLFSMPGPIADTPLAHWGVVLGLGVAIVLLFLWTQWRT